MDYNYLIIKYNYKNIVLNKILICKVYNIKILLDHYEHDATTAQRLQSLSKWRRQKWTSSIATNDSLVNWDRYYTTSILTMNEDRRTLSTYIPTTNEYRRVLRVYTRMYAASPSFYQPTQIPSWLPIYRFTGQIPMTNSGIFHRELLSFFIFKKQHQLLIE